jgi:hypothetical protein
MRGCFDVLLSVREFSFWFTMEDIVVKSTEMVGIEGPLHETELCRLETLASGGISNIVSAESKSVKRALPRFTEPNREGSVESFIPFSVEVWAALALCSTTTSRNAWRIKKRRFPCGSVSAEYCIIVIASLMHFVASWFLKRSENSLARTTIADANRKYLTHQFRRYGRCIKGSRYVHHKWIWAR